jgi:hypothetical protein
LGWISFPGRPALGENASDRSASFFPKCLRELPKASLASTYTFDAPSPERRAGFALGKLAGIKVFPHLGATVSHPRERFNDGPVSQHVGSKVYFALMTTSL